ncbi:MAG: hypothetical protein AAFP76_06615 [Bacteroidota bacterium]
MDNPQEQTRHQDQAVSDTTVTIYPMSIGNDKASVEVKRIAYEDNLDWWIKLTRSEKRVLEVPVSKEIVVDSNTSVFYQDSLHLKYVKDTRIKHITYSFIRSNTLYFEVLFENQKAQKEIFGRFNLFYGTEKKGEIYGLITDSIADISFQ